MISYTQLQHIQQHPGQAALFEAPLAVDCAVMSYREALALQEALQKPVGEGVLPGVMLLVEHPPVITLGIRKPHNRFTATEEQLRAAGIDVVPIRRGGGSTVHNPGQLVIYPVLHLQRSGFRVAPYVHYLEDAGIALLKDLGVSAESRKRYPGLWVGERKIASVGVQLSHGVSMHGIALNICNDLELFSTIVPCGIDGVEMTSALQEAGSVLPMDQVKTLACRRYLELLPDAARRSPAEQAHE